MHSFAFREPPFCFTVALHMLDENQGWLFQRNENANLFAFNDNLKTNCLYSYIYHRLGENFPGPVPRSLSYYVSGRTLAPEAIPEALIQRASTRAERLKPGISPACGTIFLAGQAGNAGLCLLSAGPIRQKTGLKPFAAHLNPDIVFAAIIV